MNDRTRLVRLGAIVTAATVLALLLTIPTSAAGSAQHVRWDIISLDTSTSPPSLDPGGFASAEAPDGGTLTLTGTGTFVAPGNKGNGSATGGGTWETFDSGGTPTGTGTYEVTRLTTFEFANLQSQIPAFTDNIGDTNERANGVAVLRIAYSDGTDGVLTVGCHGPGAPSGIFEGIAATKGVRTYYDVEPPAPGVDANRTLFHVRS